MRAALIAFMGGQGCTFGEGSRAAALAAGHDATKNDALMLATFVDRRAQQQGGYLFLNAATCTIRLPEITSAYTVNSPELIAITSPIDAMRRSHAFLESGFGDYIRIQGAATACDDG